MVSEFENSLLEAADRMAFVIKLTREYEARQREKESWREDFLGTKISPHMYSCYQECLGCGKYVWHNKHTIGLCPHCVMVLPEFTLEVSFGHSKSKKYKTALKRARAIPTYVTKEERHIVRFGNLGEYCDHRHALDELTTVIYNWKSTVVLLNGEPATTSGLHSLSWEIDRIRDLSGAKAITFSGGVPVFTPKDKLVPGEVISVDFTHPANMIEVEVTEALCENQKNRRE